MTQSLDIQTAENGRVDWQNVADKMVRLFSWGLAMELVKKDKNNPFYKQDAITEFAKLNINASFDIWAPYSESEYNQMLCTMKNAGILSQKTATEQNTVSRPDEVERINKEKEQALQEELEKERATKQLEAEFQQNTTSNSQQTQTSS